MTSGGGTDRVMVDIETLGVEPGAVILSIGAVRFGPDGVTDTFHVNIDRQSCEALGMTVDGDTMAWWQGQDEAARHVLHGGVDLHDALTDFAAWYGDADEIWANSPSFDCEHLERAYAVVDLVEPWEYYQERDVRTIKNLSIAPELDHDGVEHDARDDAIHQAQIVSETLARLEAIEA